LTLVIIVWLDWVRFKVYNWCKDSHYYSARYA
jgi:hypothetical protein